MNSKPYAVPQTVYENAKEMLALAERLGRPAGEIQALRSEVARYEAAHAAKATGG